MPAVRRVPPLVDGMTTAGFASRLLRAMKSRTGGVTLATAAAQALRIGTLIVMARLFAQADIGAYSVFLSYGAMLIMVNLLGYDWSIPSVAAGPPLRTMLSLTIALGAATSVGTATALALAGYQYPTALAVQTMSQSMISVCEQLSVRTQHYRPLIAGRVFPAVALLGAVLVMPWASDTHTPGSLIWAHVLSTGTTALVYAAVVLRPHITPPPGEPWPQPRALWTAAGTHRRFSTWMLPSQLLNRASYEVPTLMLNAWFSPAVAAQYAMSVRVCRAPVNIFAQSASRIYHGELAATVRDNLAGGMDHYRATRRRLMIGGVITLLVSALVLSWAVPMLLGDGWDLMGRIILVMSPLYAATFAVSPLTVAFVVFDEQRFMFRYSLVFFLISLGSFALAAWTGDVLLGTACFTWLSAGRYVWIAWRADEAHATRLSAFGHPDHKPGT